MTSAITTDKTAKSKAHLVAVNAGGSLVSIQKRNRAALAELGPKIIAAIRRRKPGKETASEGLRAIREGR